MEVKVTQLCPTLCDPMDYTVHGILQARILEWVAFPFSRGSSQPRDRTQVSCIAGVSFTSWATWKQPAWGNVLFTNWEANRHCSWELWHPFWNGVFIFYPLTRASLVVQLVKNLLAMQKTWVQSLGWEDPLEKGKATHSSILAWRVPWTVAKSWTWLSDFHFTLLHFILWIG